MLGLLLVLLALAAETACRALGPLSSSGTFKSAVVNVRSVLPDASVAYMTDVLLLLWPSPRTWPSSCITAVSKPYCPGAPPLPEARSGEVGLGPTVTLALPVIV